MSDSFGSLVDKLATTNKKMFINQEEIYKIRKMSFEEYKKEYFENEEGAKKLWESLKKATDLNVQRQALIQELDLKILEIIQDALSGKDLDNGVHVQRQHKTY